MKKILPVICAAAMFAGCGGGTKTGTVYNDTLYSPQYASGFTIYGTDNGNVVEIRDPWQGATDVTMQIFLSLDGAVAPEGFNGAVVNVPIRSAVCMSSSYIAFFAELGCDSVVSGVSGAGYVTNENIRRRYAEGSVADVGYDNSLNYELIARIAPDVVFMYGVTGANTTVSDKLAEMGIRTVYIGDYIENNPLGKAEWMVLMGEFTGRRELAEDMFREIALEYEEVKGLASGVTIRPEVMLNAPWRDSWFVPGDRSYMVRLLDDAGASYACAGVDDDKSRPISLETAYLAAAGADFWLGPGTVTTKTELLADNPRFKDIPAVRNGRVYNNNARVTLDGGSDFWESGTVRPHVVLKDMISIFHPELLPGHELYYFRQIE